jgi:glutamyl-tRNA synthetase
MTTTPTVIVDLESLKTEIESLGSQIKDKKSSGASKDEITALVQTLLEKKQEYAVSNNGVGVDGMPFDAKDGGGGKKKKGKSEWGAETASETSNHNQASADNAAKKEAKKAEKAAKKAAHKDGGGGGLPPGGKAVDAAPGQTSKGAPTVPPQAQAQAQARPLPPKGKVAAPSSTTANVAIRPLELIINPNDTLDRPFVALTVAVLTNTDVDLQLTSDHRVSQSMLGCEESGSENWTPIVGDLAMARYLLQRAGKSNSTPLSVANPTFQAQVDAWMDYSSRMAQLGTETRVGGIAMTVERALQARTYLVGHALSMADLAVFAALGWPCEATTRTDLLSTTLASFDTTSRWVNMMAAHPALQKATQLCVGVNGTAEAVFVEGSTLEPLVSGMNLLEGATPGNVVTRFPPEPSGYLHVGHAKAVLLNDYYARRYKGRLIVRFDDTNPSKEKEEYQQSILEDLALLGVQGDVLTYTSDYIGTIQGYALQLIEQGLAYMDDTPQEQMKEERANRIENKYRTEQTPTEAKALFMEMCSGSAEGAVWCLRAKIDMHSDNGTLRDPVLFRQNLTPHHRTGTTYKAYPTYDLACPIVDSLEGVTHALRTTEYNDRDEQYQWILKALKLRRVRIHAFARMNFTYTVLSKRKLTWFVEKGLVAGWDDARFPTVRGVVRRGVHLQALKNYIYSQGASRRVVNMVWTTFWAENKKEIDKVAKRYMAIDEAKHIVLKLNNVPDVADGDTYLETAFHPKDPALGKRVIRTSNQVLLEEGDVEGVEIGESIVLMRWGELCLILFSVSIASIHLYHAYKRSHWMFFLSIVLLLLYCSARCGQNLQNEERWMPRRRFHT